MAVLAYEYLAVLSRESVTELKRILSNRQIYSGHFDQQLQPGSGVTATLLQRHGIRVCNENEMDKLLLTSKQQP